MPANIKSTISAVRSIALRSPEVSRLVDGRIYPFAAPEDAVLPYVVVSVEAMDSPAAHSPASQGQVFTYIIGLDSFASSAENVVDVVEATINALTGWTGSINGFHIARINFNSADTQGVILDDANDAESPLTFIWSTTFRVIV